MASSAASTRVGRLYAILLHLYPKPFRERFGEGMRQTFRDMSREHDQTGSQLGFVTRTFIDTLVGIAREWTAAMHKNPIARLALITVSILMVPLLAMQFTNEVDWTFADFLVAGLLLFGAGLTYHLMANRARNAVHRSAIGLAVGAALLLMWVNLAVGVIGSEDNPANGLYVLVFAVAFLGAILTRFRPRGMARVLFATAFAQALVPLLALLIWTPEIGSVNGFVNVFAANTFFVVLFIGSALLFRQAAATE